jgi:RimJ/RimL family protein N-acetyltransferase
MKWPQSEEIVTISQGIMPEGFKLRVLASNEVTTLIPLLQEWYADIRVGLESYHLEESFYRELLEGKQGFTETDFLPLVLIDSNEALCGLVSFWKNSRAGHIYSGLGVLAPQVRGKKLAFSGPQLLEAIARRSGAGQIHYYATLRNPFQQAVAEKMGFTLAGINPGWDQDADASGQPKRVFEALYAKVLDIEAMEVPLLANLTPNTAKLFRELFPNIPLEK